MMERTYVRDRGLQGFERERDPVGSCRGGYESYVGLMMLGTKMTGKPRGWGELHLCVLTDCLD